MSPLALSLATVIGLSLGLLGGGGSILTVPVLMYALGYAAKPAIAMSLPIVGLTAAAGALLHWRRGNVRAGTALVFGGVAMLGAYAGARLARHVPAGVQLLLLAVLMIVAAIAMLRGGSRGKRDVDAPSATDGSTARTLRRALVAGVALGVGLLTGLVGIGGGFLIVPALVVLLGVPMRQAVGTSLLIIAMNSAAGLAGYAADAAIDWAFLMPFSAVAIAGALAGSALADRVPQVALRRAFALALLLVGGFVIHSNRGTFTASRPSASPRHTR